MESWTRRYNDQLANGKSVKEAAEYANTYIYLYPTITYWHLVCYTGSDMKICEGNTTTSNLSVKSSRNILENNLLKAKSINRNNVTEIIKENNEDFDINNYEIKERNGGIITDVQTGEVTYAPKYIDYQLKIGDFYTEAGYTVEIINDEITAIYDNNIDLEQQSLALKNKNEFKKSDEILKLKLENEAVNRLKIKNKKTENVITSEKLDSSIYFYDIKENKKYLMVNVESKISDNRYDSYMIETIKYEL